MNETDAPHLDPEFVEQGRRVIEEMRELAPSLRYATLLSDDGFEVVSMPGSAVEGDRFASMSSSTQALGDAVVRELKIGSGNYLILSAEEGHVIQLRVPGRAVVLAALFDTDETLGKSLSIVRRAARQVALETADV